LELFIKLTPEIGKDTKRIDRKPDIKVESIKFMLTSLYLKVYSGYFKEKYLARSCVKVSHVSKDAEIEVEAIAFYV